MGRRAIRVMDLQDLAEPRAKIERILPITIRFAAASASPRSAPTRCARARRRSRRKCCLTWSTVWRAARPRAARRQAHPVRRRARRAARHRSRHLSLRHLVQHRGGAGRDRLRRRAAARSTTCSASPRPTRRAWARGRFPTELKDETGRLLGERGQEFGTVTGRPRRCGWFDAVPRAPDAESRRHRRHRPHQARRARPLPELKICIGYRLDGREIDYLPAAQAAQARVEPIYETMEGWTQSTRGARSWAELPAQCDQICAQARGADRGPGGAAFHEPQARGHHPGARSLRGLT